MFPFILDVTSHRVPSMAVFLYSVKQIKPTRYQIIQINVHHFCSSLCSRDYLSPKLWMQSVRHFCAVAHTLPYPYIETETLSLLPRFLLHGRGPYITWGTWGTAHKELIAGVFFIYMQLAERFEKWKDAQQLVLISDRAFNDQSGVTCFVSFAWRSHYSH